MRKITFIILLLNFHLCIGQSFDKGDIVKDLKFSNVINSEVKNFNIADYFGKIVILEFWATWCAPCIPSMDHINSIQEKYYKDIEVIAITYDTPERINKYVKNKPSSIKFVSDLDERYNKFFPHNGIPHTVIIGKNNELLAITSPEELTSNVVATLVAENKFIGNEKITLTNGGFDYTKDYFPPGETTNERFMLQPALKNGMPTTRNFNKGEYKDRRVTFINMSILNIIKFAYDLSSDNSYELIGITKQELKSKRYCLDIIVTKGKNIKDFMRANLENAFPEVTLSKKAGNIEVLELQKHLENSLNLDKGTATNSASNYGVTRLNSYHKTNVTIDDFTNDYLNKFISPIFNKPIVNTTNIVGRYNIDFEFQLEDSKSFKRELGKLGLRLTPVTRRGDVLVIKSQN